MADGNSEDSFVMEDIAYEVGDLVTTHLRPPWARCCSAAAPRPLSHLSRLCCNHRYTISSTQKMFILNKQNVSVSQDNDFEEDVQTALVHTDKVRPNTSARWLSCTNIMLHVHIHHSCTDSIKASIMACPDMLRSSNIFALPTGLP